MQLNGPGEKRSSPRGYAPIEELEHAEAARRKSEERFRLLVEGARDYAMFLLDPDGRITDWSIGAERVFGWGETEALGRSAAIIFTSEDRALGVPAQELRAALAEGQVLDRRWHARKDGSRLFVDGMLTRLDDDEGRLRGFVKVGRDATAQRLAEEAVERANTELEARIAARTAELEASNQARQELLRKLVTTQEEERLRIARDLHDQLGQQITALQLGLKQLEQWAEGGSLTSMLLPLQALALDLAREAHRLAIDLRPTALDDVGLVRALEQHVRNWGAQTGVKAEFHSRGLERPRLTLLLEIALYRMVQEALTNVRKHAAAHSISVLLEQRADQVVAIVEDDGDGFVVDEVLKDGERLPLGLLGMRERVTQMGGSLEIESSPGSGTTVFARVPLDAH